LILAIEFLGFSQAHAYEIYQGTVNGKELYTNTTSIVNQKDGGAILQQDMISNANSSQTTRTFGYMFGRNLAIQNVRCDLWEGPTCTYVFPVVAQQMAVSSSSASDTGAGTGCQQVEIHYLDANYLVQATTVTLNGITPVNTTPTNILRINLFHCKVVGTGGVSAGNVSLKNIGGTVTYGYMAAGGNIAHQAIYTVPANSWGYISHWQAASGTTTGTHFTQIDVRATQHDGNYVAGLFLAVDTTGVLNNGIAITLPIPIKVPAKTDVKMSAVSDAANANAIVIGSVMGWFEAQ
jgi:hypothetical protein